MREIKFRAWDGEKMYQEGFTINPFGRLTLSEFYWEASKSVTDFTLMQYTGLKDKNGKEIYEGDIVTYYCGSDKQTNPMVVAIPDIYISDSDSDGYTATHSYEVIGNIYENLELLAHNSNREV